MCFLVVREEVDGRVVGHRRREVGHGFGPASPCVLELAEAAHGEALPEEVLVRAAEAAHVRREHRVAGADMVGSRGISTIAS